MTQVELMFVLRHRLGSVTVRWVHTRQYQYVIEQEEYDHQREVEHWMQQGKESELWNEMEFLQRLIGDLEKAGEGHDTGGVDVCVAASVEGGAVVVECL